MALSQRGVVTVGELRVQTRLNLSRIVVPAVILAHYWGAQAAEGFYHTFSGFAVFGAAFVLLLAFGIVLSRINKPRMTVSS